MPLYLSIHINGYVFGNCILIIDRKIYLQESRSIFHQNLKTYICIWGTLLFCYMYISSGFVKSNPYGSCFDKNLLYAVLSFKKTTRLNNVLFFELSTITPPLKRYRLSISVIVSSSRDGKKARFETEGEIMIYNGKEVVDY